MIIVAGRIHVDAIARSAYLEESLEVITLARAAAGCLDFHMSADPIEADRINVYERWESPAAAEAFRASGPSADQAAPIREAEVDQHEVSSSRRIF